MKLYELTCLMPLDLQEDGVKSLQEKVNSFIIDEQGTLDRIEDIAKKRLGEPQKNQTAVQVATLSFYMNPEKLNELDKKLKSESQIIRYVILNKKHRKTEAPRRIRRIAPAISEKAEKTTEKPSLPAGRSKKVEIKEIEKKLEEILGE